MDRGLRTDIYKRLLTLGRAMDAQERTTERTFIASDLEAAGLHAGSITALARPIVPQPIEVQKLSGDGMVWVWPPDLSKATSSRSVWPEHCPFGQPGDTLAVKETWCKIDYNPIEGDIAYKADCMRPPGYYCSEWSEDADVERARKDYGYKWQSPAIMPRDLIRLRLTVLEVHVWRVQELTAINLQELGFDLYGYAPKAALYFGHQFFEDRWNRRYARKGYPYRDNPWVWFVRVEKGAGECPST